MEPSDCKEAADGFLAKNNIEGTVVFASLTGSQAYGLAHHGSDLDYVGVYVFPTKQFLSFNVKLPRESLSSQHSPIHNDDIDITLYEVGQFIELLYEGLGKRALHYFSTLISQETHFALKLSSQTKIFILLPSGRKFLESDI